MILDTLEERMSFLENMGYDKYFYACFSSSKIFNVEYEIWLKDDQWIIRQRPSDVSLEEYPRMSKQQVLENLDCLGINKEEFLDAINIHCMNQVFYADLVTKEAVRLFGAQFIKNAIDAQDKFTTELIDVIRQTTNTKEIISGDGQTTPKRTGHLTVIK
jgi:hypothetical protein